MNKRIQDKENAKVLFTILNICLFLILFLVTIVKFYEFTNFALYGYIIITFIYLVIFVIFGNMFEIFELGETTVKDLFLSYSLTLFITNFLIYFINSLISFKMVSALPLFILQIVNMVLSAYILLVENRFIRDKFPVPKAIAIFGEPNYEILEKIYKHRDILVNVNKKVDIKDINFNFICI